MRDSAINGLAMIAKLLVMLDSAGLPNGAAFESR
jgi:hypothetical protein